MRTMRVMLAAVAGLAVGGTAHAQRADLDVGARVRVFAPALSARGIQGVVAGSGDTLVLLLSNARLRIPASAIDRLELSRGRSRMAGARRGMPWGAAIGVVMGAVTTEQARYALGSCDEYAVGCDRPPTAGQRATYVGTIAVGGAVWGAVIGAVAGRERWDAMPLGHVSLRPAAGGARVAMRYAIR